MSKKVFIVGGTGSLGRRAIEIVRKLNYELVGVSGFRNYELLNSIAEEFKPKFILLNKDFIDKVVFKDGFVLPIEKLKEGIGESQPDIVLFLASNITSLKAIEFCLSHGIRIGIANKESIIAGGEILFEGKEFGNTVLPVDSETAAIFQIIEGVRRDEIENVILTASGGPLFGFSREGLKDVKVNVVLEHPNWHMGNKITVDSSNLVNKAFEVIETHFLFNIPYSRIQAIVHRESIIHAMVEFIDGEFKAVLSVPDMSIPIQYALTYPERKTTHIKHLDFLELQTLSFYEIDKTLFPLFDILLNYAMLGGSFLPSIVAIDEVLVESFLKEEIAFLDIEHIFIDFLNTIEYRKIDSLDEVEDVYNNTKKRISEFIRRRL